jgi:small ligand-binding sensory domain FIST
MICADPFTFDLKALLSRLENDYPTVAVVGGLASAGRSPGSNQLWLGSHKYTDGAIGVIFEPGIASPIVSQGCRPVGTPWTVTEVDRNRIRSLGGAPAMQRLRETIRNLSLDDTKLANDGLHIGFAGSDQIDQPVQGEFLVRAVLGGDPETGALAVGADVEIGQLVQFHIRDPASADSELGYLVTRATKGCDPSAALVFTCNGRGTNMFSEPHHDARLMSELVGGAVGGMFCAGEVGPVAGRNALHGLTATALLF